VSIGEINVESKQELEQMITKEIDKIEKGLTVVCSHVPINDNTTLDILCHDNDGQLVILQLNVNEDDNMLLRGIQSLDYVDKLKSFLKATYNKYKINEKKKPRLILVAPSFSEALCHAVEYMQGVHIDLYGWEYLKPPPWKPIFAWKKKEEKEEEPTEKKREPKPAKNKEKARKNLNQNRQRKSFPSSHCQQKSQKKKRKNLNQKGKKSLRKGSQSGFRITSQRCSADNRKSYSKS
jgi:hypothetical protein